MDSRQTRSASLFSETLLRTIPITLFALASLVSSATSQPQVWQPFGQSLVGKSIYSLHLCASGTILAGSSNGDLFRSTDEGNSWRRVRKGQASIDMLEPERNAVRAFAENHEGTIVAGTDQGELVFSTDDGRTWNLVSTLPYKPDIRDIMIGEKGEMLLATYRDGILRASANEGGWNSFEQIFNKRPLLSLGSRPGELIVGTFQQGAYHSTDGGESWSALRNGLMERGWYQSISSMVTDSLGELVGVSDLNIFFLKPGDTTWVPYKGDFNLSKLTRRGSKVLGLSYGPPPFPTFAESVGDIHRWNRVPQYGFGDKFYKRAVTYTAKYNILVGGEIHGIYRTTNGGNTWEQKINGLTNTYILSLAADEQSRALYAGTLHEGLFRSLDDGATWTNIGLREAPVLAVAVKGPYIYVANAAVPRSLKKKPDFLRSDDGGMTWSSFSPGLDSSIRLTIALGTKEEVFLGTRGQGIFFSPNNAERWEPRNDGLPGKVVYDIVLLGQGTVYAATPKGVFWSANNGKKWVLAGLKDIECLRVARDSKNQLFVGTDNDGMHRYEVKKNAWGKVRFPLTTVNVLNIDGGGTIVAGDESQRLFRSTDEGEKWLPYDDGLPEHLTSASILAMRNSLIVASLGDGIFKADRYGRRPTGALGSTDSVAHAESKRVLPTSKSAADIEIFVRNGHSDLVRSIAFSPDGRLLASASADKTFRVWDAATGKQIRSYAPTDFECFSVAFSPDGKFLFGGGQQSLWVWDLTNVNPVRRVQGELGWFKVLAFSRDGNLLATGQGSGMIQLWNPKTYTPLKTLQHSSRREAEITDLLFLDSAKTLLSRNISGQLMATSLERGRDTTWRQFFPDPVRCVFVNREGRCFAAAGSASRYLDIWDCNSMNIVQSIDGIPDDVLKVAFAANGELLLTTERSNLLEVWSTSTGVLLQTIDLGGWCEDMVSSPSDSGLVTSCGTELRYFEVHWPQFKSGSVLVERFRLPGPAARVQSIAFTSDDQTITYGRSDGKISRFKITGQPTITTWQTDMPVMQSVSVSPSNPIIATLGRDCSVALWNTHTGEKLRTLMGGGTRTLLNPVPHGIAISPNGKFLASILSGSSIKLWSLPSGVSVAALLGPWRWAEALTFSQDSKLLAVGGEEGSITLWSTENQREIRTLRHTPGFIKALSFDPGGMLLASASANGWFDWIDLWDVKAGKLTRSLANNVPYVRCLRLMRTDDAGILASGHEDGSIRIWDYLKGKLIAAINAHSYAVTGLVFASKGSVLISSSQDGTIKLWNAMSGTELASVFVFGDKDWVATTPEGRFDGTEEGMKRVSIMRNGQLVSEDQSKLGFRHTGLLSEILR